MMFLMCKYLVNSTKTRPNIALYVFCGFVLHVFVNIYRNKYVVNPRLNNLVLKPVFVNSSRFCSYLHHFENWGKYIKRIIFGNYEQVYSKQCFKT